MVVFRSLLFWIDLIKWFKGHGHHLVMMNWAIANMVRYRRLSRLIGLIKWFKGHDHHLVMMNWAAANTVAPGKV